jgi:hypothetical protein
MTDSLYFFIIAFGLMLIIVYELMETYTSNGLNFGYACDEHHNLTTRCDIPAENRKIFQVTEDLLKNMAIISSMRYFLEAKCLEMVIAQSVRSKYL